MSAALHAALLGAFALAPDAPPMSAAAAGAISVSVVAAPPGLRPSAPAAPPTAPPPPPVGDVEAAAAADAAAVEPLELAQAPPPADPPAETPAAPPSAASGAEAGGCAVSDGVLAALQAEAPRAALARIPDRRRSVAGAVMLWDGGWIRSGALADAGVARPIQKAIAEAVRRAEPACAAAPVSGPVLLIVPDPSGSLVLVLGSGTWRWADLAAAG